MKAKRFFKSFFGAFIGVIIYKLFFEISDPFDSYWANFLSEAALIGICIFIVMMIISLLTGDLSLSDSNEKA